MSLFFSSTPNTKTSPTNSSSSSSSFCGFDRIHATAPEPTHVVFQCCCKAWPVWTHTATQKGHQTLGRDFANHTTHSRRIGCVSTRTQFCSSFAQQHIGKKINQKKTVYFSSVLHNSTKKRDCFYLVLSLVATETLAFVPVAGFFASVVNSST